MLRPHIRTAWLALLPLSATAQTVPQFEAASVKAAPPRSGREALFATDTDPAMIRYFNLTLKNLISMAYRVDSNRVQAGPSWIDEQFYDVAAKLPDGASKDQVPAMLQDLLKQRFSLAVHRESKEQRVYFLGVGKNGPKLTEATPPETPTAADTAADQVRGDRLPAQILKGRIVGHAIRVRDLAGLLSMSAGYPVVDRTGLSKTYDIDLKWTPDGAQGNRPGLFTAIQEELGLKLESGRAPVEVLVVDRAERVPAAN